MRISDWSSDVCSSDLRLRLLSAAPAEVKASTDPLMQAAARLLPAALREEDADKQLAGELLRLRPSYMKGLIGYRRSEEHKSELQSLMRISYAVFCLKKNNKNSYNKTPHRNITTKC